MVLRRFLLRFLQHPSMILRGVGLIMGFEVAKDRIIYIMRGKGDAHARQSLREPEAGETL